MSSGPSDPLDDTDSGAQELREFVAELYQHPDREAVASEIEVLQSIYGEDAIRVWHPPSTGDGETKNSNGYNDPRTLRYALTLSLPSYDTVSVKLLVSLPQTYPVSSPPQLQLLSRYIGAFGADAGLFGSILRTYISVNGVEFTPESVCVFDGVQSVLERCNTWYEEHLNGEKIKELVRDDEKEARGGNAGKEEMDTGIDLGNEGVVHPSAMPPGVQFFIAEPIVDRKSSFIGRACRISDPSEVPQVLAHLMSDRRIARAAHPVINAWRCQVGSVLHQDNDDDGESAAGGRLAHLLQILEVNNVLVVVTRYFGGIHLGPDRFKHINQAARNALELGGFLDGRVGAGRGRRH